jgi:hypothetical protein
MRDYNLGLAADESSTDVLKRFSDTLRTQTENWKTTVDRIKGGAPAPVLPQRESSSKYGTIAIVAGVALVGLLAFSYFGKK